MKGIQDHPVESLDLPISLGMAGRRKELFYPELSESCEEDLRRELRKVVRLDMTGWTVRENPVAAKVLRYRGCGCNPKRNGPGEFGKVVCHHQQKAVSMTGFG
jgi:hypothetical protein